GLYYVKQIVEAHNGTITVHSTPGKGTEFKLKIPVENGLIAG
ncbi:MAG: HAMP domain-containing histidine kinase, partial [Bacteroidales bacterium]|nr:HAMP domain-containing histidine kinase [Bacteroidales bacterium]